MTQAEYMLILFQWTYYCRLWPIFCSSPVQLHLYENYIMQSHSSTIKKKNGAEYAQALGKTTPTIPRTTQAMITMQEGNAYHTSFQAWFWCWGLLFIQHSTSSAPTARIKWQTWSSQRMKNRNSARGFLPGWGARARSWSGSVKRE